MKTSYTNKLHNNKDLPKKITLNKEEQKKWGGKTMVVAKPIDVYECINNIKKGYLATTKQIREYLARKYGVDVACPLTTGIFINISAHAADEMEELDMPFWRVLKTDGSLNSKFPEAPHKQIRKLAQEGFDIEIQNRRYFVKDYEKFLYRL